MENTQPTHKKQKEEWNQEFHGLFGNRKWKNPKCTLYSEELQRPKQSHITKKTKSEYCDHPDVLAQKIKLLSRMIKQSKQCVIYAGAGISTSAGIGDYASKNKKGSLKGGKKRRPTYAHHAITLMHDHKNNYIKHWCQQNHDGLAQKSGFPCSKVNEIHGSWFDKQNPVVKMDGKLGESQFEILQQWAVMSDLTIAIGTSLAGMTSDCTAEQPIEKLQVYGKGQGLVIINNQLTRLHCASSLNIFNDIDKTFAMLLKELKIEMPKTPKVYMKMKDWIQ